MSEADKLAQWREFLKDPVRQRILLKLGEYDRLNFDELLKEVKIDDRMQLYNELQILRNLVSKAKSDNYLHEREGGLEDISDKYMLTEEGHEVVDWFIAFPELASSKRKPWFDMLKILLIIFGFVVIIVVIYLILAWLGFSLDLSN